MLRTIGIRTVSARSFARFYSLDSAPRPGPPKLDKEEQEEFERLQKSASTEAVIEEYNSQIEENRESTKSPFLKAGDASGFSPEFFKTIPEFEGDVNPVTGEIGGPKQDPLRHGDYSFNGRVTDF